jgi:NAD(P)H-dependent FMN reductase
MAHAALEGHKRATMVKIAIILGSTRQGRRGERVAHWVVERARSDGEMDVEFIDLIDYPLPFYDDVRSPAMHRGDYASELALTFVRKIAAADGFIIVTPEYNHSFPAVLKNALDYGYVEWNNKPLACVSYSGGLVGGARAVEQLRLVAIELQMAPIRDGVHVGGVRQAFDEQGRMVVPFHEERLAGMFRQLKWWARALKEAREKDA